jgi:hypothetical protein
MKETYRLISLNNEASTISKLTIRSISSHNCEPAHLIALAFAPSKKHDAAVTVTATAAAGHAKTKYVCATVYRGRKIVVFY